MDARNWPFNIFTSGLRAAWECRSRKWPEAEGSLESGRPGTVELLGDARSTILSHGQQVEPGDAPAFRGAQERELVAAITMAVGRRGIAFEPLPRVHVGVHGGPV